MLLSLPVRRGRKKRGRRLWVGWRRRLWVGWRRCRGGRGRRRRGVGFVG